jgi:hypothetical protein
MIPLITVIGIIAGFIGFFYYLKSTGKTQDALKVGIFTILGLGTPLHCVIVPSIVGVTINRIIYSRTNRNLFSFFISLIGVLPITAIMSATGKLYLVLLRPGPMGFGEAFAAGIGMGLMYALFIVIGGVVYILSSLGISIQRA